MKLLELKEQDVTAEDLSGEAGAFSSYGETSSQREEEED